MVEGHWDLVGYSFLAVVERSTGLLVGRVGPWQPYGWPGLEVGWTIHPRRGRRGYAVEAAIAACAWTFAREPQLRRLIHVIAPGNKGSEAVARKIGGEDTGEAFTHPVAGTLNIWATPRERILS
jgi:RimJ/RimL family protein N-acetyltransferase